MKKLLQTHHRPLCWVAIYFIVGIIGGTIWANSLYSSFFCWSLGTVLLTAVLVSVFKSNWWWAMGVIALVGGICYLYTPVTCERALVEACKYYSGTIKEIKTTDYNTQLTMKDVSIYTKDKVQSISSKIIVISEEDYGSGLEVGDKVKVEGEVLELKQKYNPSDMDYASYLKSKGIVAEVEARSVLKIGSGFKGINKIQQSIISQIQRVYQGEDQGIVTAMLLGDKSYLDSDVSRLYSKLGIGHILAISGLHVGLVWGLVWAGLSSMRLSYKQKNIGAVLLIWCYCILCGLSVSAVRASMIITIIIIGRVLWEEEDLPICLAIAVLCVLGWNPYQLFQVGFQLSFVAYSGVLIFIKVSECSLMSLGLSKKKMKWINTLGGPLMISLMITPVLAYHFYEVPFLAILLNYIVVPLVALLMPLMMLSIAISYIWNGLGVMLAGGISLVLRGITAGAELMAQIPGATLVTGQPSLIVITCYYGMLGCLLMYCCRSGYRKYLEWSMVTLIGVLLIAHYVPKPLLEIAHLYVGQGDAAVIITPYGQVIVIDAGPEGKGDDLERYLKYKGKHKIDYMIVSHAHADHIGGVMDLIDLRMPIENILMPVMPKDDTWTKRLQKACEVEQIPYYFINDTMTLEMGSISIDFLAPVADKSSSNLNDLSAVCLVKYEEFEMLFTGDLPIEGERSFYAELSDIDVLKVAHHGSSTSTSDKLLEQTRPEYGIISCGINNRYAHPSPLVVERLEQKRVSTIHTDKVGAIVLETDGKKLKINTQIQEATQAYGGVYTD